VIRTARYGGSPSPIGVGEPPYFAHTGLFVAEDQGA
jgi:hypothetical protein